MWDRAARAARRWRSSADRALARIGEHSGRRLEPNLPFTLRLDHPPTADARPRYGYGRPAHRRVEAVLQEGIARYCDHVAGFSAYVDDLAAIPVAGQDGPEPCWVNPWLIGLDTVSLYCFARRRRPARYVEVGSGQSTKVIDRARRDGGLRLEITSIDPQPRTEVDGICDRPVRLPLETVDLDACFGGLAAGDMVFFDGSHRVLPNSDCVAFYLDVLPSLPPGVLVGVHDIWLPDDYPQDFLGLWWSEQYLVAALLVSQPEWLSVELPTYFASGLDEVSELMDPLFGRREMAGVNRRGSVCWFETRGR